jgi:hypothetical protein
MTTITNYKSDRNVCYHGCVLVHHLTVLNTNETEGDKLLAAGICVVLVNIKETYSSDQPINSIVSSMISKFPFGKRLIKRPFGIPFVRREYVMICIHHEFLI